MKTRTLLFIAILVFASCKQTDSKLNPLVSETEQTQEEYQDGEYCAEVNYYNSDTGKNATYTLPVAVENGELVKLQWSNGGWLDNSHFTAPNITDGTASFEDDRGRQFEVKLLEQGTCDDSNSSSNEDLEEEE
jgi:hypothetical protein